MQFGMATSDFHFAAALCLLKSTKMFPNLVSWLYQKIPNESIRIFTHEHYTRLFRVCGMLTTNYVGCAATIRLVLRMSMRVCCAWQPSASSNSINLWTSGHIHPPIAKLARVGVFFFFTCRVLCTCWHRFADSDGRHIYRGRRRWAQANSQSVCVCVCVH